MLADELCSKKISALSTMLLNVCRIQPGKSETWKLVLRHDAGGMEQEASYLCTGEFKHIQKCLWA